MSKPCSPSADPPPPADTEIRPPCGAGAGTLADWFQTPLGQHALQFERLQHARLVGDLFGYNAVQIGLPELDFLAANRMPLRLPCDAEGGMVRTRAVELPFASASIDLVLLPHVLEFSDRPHQVLREVERVLVPEGQLLITGFNPYSLWGARRLLARGKGSLPWRGQYLSIHRLKDWLTLLSFENQSSVFGCHAPAFVQQKWLDRCAFLERAGQRWWSVCGAIYILHAVKKVQGMRLITPNWRDSRKRVKGLAPIAQRGRPLTKEPLIKESLTKESLIKKSFTKEPLTPKPHPHENPQDG